MNEEAVDCCNMGNWQWCRVQPGGVVLMQLGNVADYGLRIVCSYTCVSELEWCSSMGTGLWDAA